MVTSFEIFYEAVEFRGFRPRSQLNFSDSIHIDIFGMNVLPILQGKSVINRLSGFAKAVPASSDSFDFSSFR